MRNSSTSVLWYPSPALMIFLSRVRRTPRPARAVLGRPRTRQEVEAQRGALLREDMLGPGGLNPPFSSPVHPLVPAAVHPGDPLDVPGPASLGLIQAPPAADRSAPASGRSRPAAARKRSVLFTLPVHFGAPERTTAVDITRMLGGPIGHGAEGAEVGRRPRTRRTRLPCRAGARGRWPNFMTLRAL